MTKGRNMGKRGGGKFGRRTVLQLDDESKPPPTFGLGYKPAGGTERPGTASVLGGLRGQYGSDSDHSQPEEEGGEEAEAGTGKLRMQAFVPSMEQPVLEPAAESKALANGAAGAEEASQAGAGQPAARTAHQSEVDAQLQSFLAEIDAMEAPSKTDTAEEDRGGAQGGGANGEQSAGQQPEPPPPKPTEPESAWQQCVDEGTQCYYYWNTASNEVTWTLPEGYSQFLLAYREYERQLQLWERRLAQWKQRHGEGKEAGVAPNSSSPGRRASIPPQAPPGAPDTPADGPQPEPATNRALEAGDATGGELLNGDVGGEEAGGGDLDVDAELDMALSQTGWRGGVKRQGTDLEVNDPEFADPEVPDPKRRRTDAEEEEEDEFPLSKQFLRSRMNDLVEVAGQARLVCDKLRYLDVGVAGLSKLQLLLVQLQTRMEDFGRGALAADYFSEQVRAAVRHLESYEASAAPRGWTCRWHRQYRRYYYLHADSGQCQWEYPEQPGDSAGPSGTEAPQSAAQSAVDFKSLVGAPPPPPPAPESGREPVEAGDTVEAESVEKDLTESAEPPVYGPEPRPQSDEQPAEEGVEPPVAPETEPALEPQPAKKPLLANLTGYDASDSEEEEEAEVGGETKREERSEGELSDTSVPRARSSAHSHSPTRSLSRSRSRSPARSKSRSPSRSKSTAQSRSRSPTRSRSRGTPSPARSRSTARSSVSPARSHRSRKRSRSSDRRRGSESRSDSRSPQRKHKHRKHKHHKKHSKKSKRKSKKSKSKHRKRRSSRSGSHSPSRSPAAASSRSPSPESRASSRASTQGDPHLDAEAESLARAREAALAAAEAEAALAEAEAALRAQQHAGEESQPAEESPALPEHQEAEPEAEPQKQEPQQQVPGESELDGTPLDTAVDEQPSTTEPVPHTANGGAVRSGGAQICAPPVLISLHVAAAPPPLNAEAPKEVEGEPEPSRDAKPSKEKKKKKDKALTGGGLAMKKKGVTNLVQKWQQVQRQADA